MLAKGAAQFGFLSPQPSFAGHQLCSPQPYVQGLTARAPFHPTPLGQLAIALADQAAIAPRGQLALKADPAPGGDVGLGHRPGRPPVLRLDHAGLREGKAVKKPAIWARLRIVPRADASRALTLR